MRADELATVAGTVFVVSDALGNITQGEAQGLFAADTRYLSQFELRIENADIVLLRSGSPLRGRSDIYATNSGRRRSPPHSLELYRRRELSGQLHETIELTNRGETTLELPLTIQIASDFADIFEVRAGPDRYRQRGVQEWNDGGLVIDDRRKRSKRRTTVMFDPPPETTSRGTARYAVRLDPNATWSLSIRVSWLVPAPESTLPIPIPVEHDEAGPVSEWVNQSPTLETDDADLLSAYTQAVDDLASLEIALDSGHPIPAAGLPWYLAIFGRDSIITSSQCLLTGSRQAYGTLRSLAAYQSTQNSAFRDSEPGKIAHEIRFGQLAVSDAIPHARYYGTVDATPLWITLLHTLTQWTQDHSILTDLCSHLDAALHWIDQYGDLDGDGFIEYLRRSQHGLVNQGWKDSWDGVRFADGSIAEGPIALVEVQGYVVAAKRGAASLMEILGRKDDADRRRREADVLQHQIQQAFWIKDEGYFAVALDGKKRLVDSITSNPGHLLWAGAVDKHYSGAVAERLLDREMFSGWGIRTLSTTMRAYNPFSYHNGSVWPHDNSLIVAGLAHYGFGDRACRVINAMIDASTCFPDHRLPELFCGYSRDRTSFPVDYPVACSPQAWAAGSVILMLQTIAGIVPGTAHLEANPLDHGRELHVHGVRYRGKQYRVSSSHGRSSVEPTGQYDR